MSANYGEYEFNFSTKDGEKDEARAKTAFDWCVEEYDWFEEDGFYLSGNSIKMDGNYCSALGDEGNEDEMKEWITGMAEASGAEVIFGYYISDHTESANEFYWKGKFSYVDGKCSVKMTGYRVFEKEASPAETVVIPDGTTKIAKGKYKNYMSLLFVSIPASVTEIGEDAFSGCDLLVSVKFGGTVAQWEAVEGKWNLCLHLNAKSVRCADGEWQKSVVYVKNGVAVKCLDENATSVTIPEGVTKIGGNAFFECKSLKSVEIPSSVTEIGGCAFYWCKSLTSVEIPSSVTEIGGNAFFECKSLKSVKIPSSVTEIGWNAFKGCKSLTSVEIPPNVTAIGGFAFRCCSSLKSVEIPSSVTAIGEAAFEGCTSLTSVEIPSSVTEIGNSAFSGCRALSSVEIPSSVTEIGTSAFKNCKSLTSVEIPSSVTAIGGFAFRCCSSLTSVKIPSSVTKIGGSAFSGCTSLSSVEFGGTVAQWKAMKKGAKWHVDVPATSVKCSDGEAEL